jgi:hypothetical protein
MVLEGTSKETISLKKHSWFISPTLFLFYPAAVYFMHFAKLFSLVLSLSSPK